MNVLTLNPGSSSLRFKLLRTDPHGEHADVACLASGAVAGLGSEARARAGLGLETGEMQHVRARDHGEATAWALEWLGAQDGADRLDCIDAVGIRVVHGGGQECAGLLATPDVESGLERLTPLAPLHTQASLETLRCARRSLPSGLPIAAVFDTAFHADMPEVARTYALPSELAERHRIRRFGFHGIAVASVVEQHAQSSPDRSREERVVVAHLGSGASVTAVRSGRSIDTSMGFSPLEGLVMATRSGDIDPSLVSYLASAEGTSADDIVMRLNQNSGLLGISGCTSDMREIERLRAKGDPRATLAFDLFTYRAKKHLAAMIATVDGVDTVLFSGGVGENSAAVRAAICSGMAWCGIVVDPALNAAPARDARKISSSASPVGVYVIPADEERIIARTTSSLVAKEHN